MIPKAAFSLCWNGHRLDLGGRTQVMGVLNVTPDSFADGGRYMKEETAIAHGLAMAAEGADILDVGGESTRPFAEQVPAEEEAARVVPVIEALAREVDIPISIDTTKAEVARAAFQAGASILNDVSALRFDPVLPELAAEAGVPVVLMHMKGEPRNMQKDPTYEALIPEVSAFLEDAVQRAVEAGIARERILIDPGIGFGKTFDHNVQLLRDLSELSKLGLPVVLGCSRKAFLGGILGKEPDGRDVGTMAAVATGILNGAHVVRVHNVEMAVDTVRVIDAIQRGSVTPAEN